jgi:hypothetical protein
MFQLSTHHHQAVYKKTERANFTAAINSHSRLKSSTSCLKRTTLASLVNIIGSDKVFTLSGRSFMHKMKSTGPTNDLGIIPYFTVPQSEKIF